MIVGKYDSLLLHCNGYSFGQQAGAHPAAPLPSAAGALFDQGSAYHSSSALEPEDSLLAALLLEGEFGAQPDDVVMAGAEEEEGVEGGRRGAKDRTAVRSKSNRRGHRRAATVAVAAVRARSLEESDMLQVISSLLL
jgi:hypothetical protein